jgi:CcmD family protein
MHWMCYAMRSTRSLPGKMGERMEKNFWYLFVAYSTIWTALCVYMMYLSQKNKELQAELRDLRSQLERVLTK